MRTGTRDGRMAGAIAAGVWMSRPQRRHPRLAEHRARQCSVPAGHPWILISLAPS